MIAGWTNKYFDVRFLEINYEMNINKKLQYFYPKYLPAELRGCRVVAQRPKGLEVFCLNCCDKY